MPKFWQSRRFTTTLPCCETSLFRSAANYLHRFGAFSLKFGALGRFKGKLFLPTSKTSWDGILTLLAGRRAPVSSDRAAQLPQRVAPTPSAS